MSLETSPLLRKDAHSRLENHELVDGVTGPKARYYDSSQIWSLEIRHRKLFMTDSFLWSTPFPSFPLALKNTHGKSGTSETRGLEQAKQRRMQAKFKDKPFFSNQ